MSKAGAFAGTWRILEMEIWDKDAFNLVGPAHFTFGRDGLGNFRFIAVEGELDCRYSEEEGKPRVDFTWEGNDECDPASGRGWAVRNGDVIVGRIFLHLGDDSAFTARRTKVTRPARKSRSRRRPKHRP